jgi:hypothetical protein
MKRYRVRVAAKTYQDPGPDLLRPQGTASQVFAQNMGKATTGWFTRRRPSGGNWSEWRGPMPKRDALEEVETFTGANPKAKFQAGRMKGKSIDPKAEMLIVSVTEFALPDVNPGAKLVAWLAKEQFPNINVGGFSCREFNGIPGSGWSDHAWGDAVDLVPSSGGGPNDDLTDWCVRMAKAHCMGDVNQFIGSNRGRVVNFVAPTYAMNNGGPSSHLTHVHSSYRQHFGANPHCR